VVVVGVVLMAVGAALLVVADAPRRVLASIVRLPRLLGAGPGGRHGGRNVSPGTTFDPRSEVEPWDVLAPFRGLDPGWYREREDRALARYWDGTALSDERRRVDESATAAGRY